MLLSPIQPILAYKMERVTAWPLFVKKLDDDSLAIRSLRIIALTVHQWTDAYLNWLRHRGLIMSSAGCMNNSPYSSRSIVSLVDAKGMRKKRPGKMKNQYLNPTCSLVSVASFVVSRLRSPLSNPNRDEQTCYRYLIVIVVVIMRS